MARIMLVDDSHFIKSIIQNIITTCGHAVIGEASNGAEAIALYPKLQPDLVFMDITMPEMTGIHATQEILKLDADARIVMCSAMGQNLMIKEALQVGAKDFIVKPFQNEKIKEVIEKHAKIGPVL